MSKVVEQFCVWVEGIINQAVKECLSLEMKREMKEMRLFLRYGDSRMTMKEVMRHARVGKSTVYEAINSGLLRAEKRGNEWSFRYADVELWVNSLGHVSREIGDMPKNLKSSKENDDSGWDDGDEDERDSV